MCGWQAFVGRKLNICKSINRFKTILFVWVLPVKLKLGCQVPSASWRDTTHTQGFSNPHYSFPSKKVKKVGGYPIEKTPQSQELPPPMLEVPTILASARGHGVLAFAKIVSTSNIGLESK